MRQPNSGGVLSQEAQVLARAVKEQERRQGHKEGFSSLPADCLAYKYYRDAVEMRNAASKAQLVARGLSVATTEDARAALVRHVAPAFECCWTSIPKSCTSLECQPVF